MIVKVNTTLRNHLSLHFSLCRWRFEHVCFSSRTLCRLNGGWAWWRRMTSKALFNTASFWNVPVLQTKHMQTTVKNIYSIFTRIRGDFFLEMGSLKCMGLWFVMMFSTWDCHYGVSFKFGQFFVCIQCISIYTIQMSIIWALRLGWKHFYLVATVGPPTVIGFMSPCANIVRDHKGSLLFGNRT